MNNIEEKLKQLREDWVNYPGKREIIKRQVRALELSKGVKLIKTPPQENLI